MLCLKSYNVCKRVVILVIIGKCLIISRACLAHGQDGNMIWMCDQRHHFHILVCPSQACVHVHAKCTWSRTKSQHKWNSPESQRCLCELWQLQCHCAAVCAFCFLQSDSKTLRSTPGWTFHRPGTDTNYSIDSQLHFQTCNMSAPLSLSQQACTMFSGFTLCCKKVCAKPLTASLNHIAWFIVVVQRCAMSLIASLDAIICFQYCCMQVCDARHNKLEPYFFVQMRCMKVCKAPDVRLQHINLMQGQKCSGQTLSLRYYSQQKNAVCRARWPAVCQAALHTFANKTGASALIIRTSSSDFIICRRNRCAEWVQSAKYDESSGKSSVHRRFTFLMRARGNWWFLNSAGSVPTCWISTCCCSQNILSCMLCCCNCCAIACEYPAGLYWGTCHVCTGIIGAVLETNCMSIATSDSYGT